MAPGVDEGALHVRLLRLFASPDYDAPVLPEVAIEVHRLAQREAVEFAEVSAVLERDPLLAARVLARAGSALFASRTPITTLRAAVVRLGLAAVRDLVLEAALTTRIFRAPGYDAIMARLAQHASTTAHLLRAFGGRLGIEPEHGFLVGLLHDVGIAACCIALADDRRGGPVPYEAVGGVVDEVHEGVSAMVSRLWGLAPELHDVLGSHHRLAASGPPEPTRCALVVAEHLAAELGAGMEPRGPDGPAVEGLDTNPAGLFEEACEALGLDVPALVVLRGEANELLRALEASEPARPGA